METRNQEITAGWVDVLIQSGISAERYFQAARKTLDESGMKYKASDVIALANIAASDYRSASISIAAQKIAAAIATHGRGECPTDGIAAPPSFSDVETPAPVGDATSQEEKS